MIAELRMDDKVRRIATHLTAEVQGESVILHGTEGVYFGLNATGTRLWNLIQSEAEVQGVIATICSEFAAPEEGVRRDVLAILNEMVEAGLVEVLPTNVG